MPALVPEQVVAEIVEQAVVDKGSTVDKSVGTDHNQGTVGNIADTVVDTTGQVSELQAWLEVQDLQLLADSRSEQY